MGKPTATPGFDHERPSELDEFEFGRKFANTPSGQVLHVVVSKVGGGTVGKPYAGGYWHYMAVTEGQGAVMEGSDLHIGASATHADAAEQVFKFYLAR